MLIAKYYYTSQDLLQLGTSASDNGWATGDVEDFEDIFSTTSTILTDNSSAIASLITSYLVSDNHFVVASTTDSSEDEQLPSIFGDPTAALQVDNDNITEFYRNFYLWLNETAPIYTKKLSVYTDLVSNLTAKPTSSTTNTTGTSDMPITASFDDAPTSDVLSNLVQSTTETEIEATTPLDRYEAALNSIRNIMKEWYDEYIRRFALYE